MGGYYLETDKDEYKIAVDSKNIPDNIKDVNDEILDGVSWLEW